MADRLPGRDAGVAAKARLAEIYTSKRFSDHATLIIDYSAPAAGDGARKRE